MTQPSPIRINYDSSLKRMLEHEIMITRNREIQLGLQPVIMSGYYKRII